MKVIHSWLKDYLGESLPDVNKVEELLTFHAFEVDGIEEVAGESVIDVDVLPNRSSDCLSMRGIARELATITDTALARDPLAELVSLSPTDKVSIQIADSAACPRFTASVITGVTIKESPEWLQKRLRAMGQRPINNIVDATNYVMYSLGQPMHAYDADLFPQMNGQWQIGIRFAVVGETVSLLAEGGKTEDRIIELTGTELLIVEGSTDSPVGLAGVKGGRFAELHSGTKNIIIEAAHFDPQVIRKTARRLGILTDASKRFENEPSRELPPYAQRDIIKLITEIAGGECVGLVDEYLVKQKENITNVSRINVNRLLGLNLSLAEVKKIILRTGAEVIEEDSDSITVRSPWERSDLVIEEDYIEEVGRIYGLHNIVSVMPEAQSLAEINVKQYYTERIRRVLLEQGFSEVMTSSFQKKGTIQLQNALASDKSYVRESLRKNITAVLDANFIHTDLLGIPDIRVFEIGTVFIKTETSVSEYIAISLGVRTKGNGYSPKDDVIIKNGCTAVEKILGAEVVWQTEKGVAEGNLDVVLKTLPVPDAYDALPALSQVSYKAFSLYPAIARDIALWVDDGVVAEVVAETLVAAAGPLLVRHTLFDTFTKDARTSYAFRLIFQSTERTLTDIEINPIMETVYQAVTAKGWEGR
ncbi:MAG: hypothetical protein RLZZ230_60 [Candidatus Parcubacteria bacterium]|jgi:phenylalanyl-tRNA synthetase beta chain